MGEGTSWWRLGRRSAMVLVAVLVAALSLGLWWSQSSANDQVARGGSAGGDVTAGSDPSVGPTPAADPSAGTAPSSSAPAVGDAAAAPASPATAVADTPDQIAVPSVDVVELPPVPLTAPADFGNQVTARVAAAVRVAGEGKGIGERSGPALQLTIEISNASAAAVDLDYLVVNLFGADGAPGQTLWGDPRSAPLAGALAPGETRSGDFVLTLPDPAASTVKVTVSYGASTPTAVFAGDVTT